MNLTLLRHTPQLTVYYDSWNNCLFLDWHGELTLTGVQTATLALATCCAYPYQRVLNSNEHVTHVPGSVVAWLGLELLPLLQQVGVEQLAWVRAEAASGRHLVDQALRWLRPLQVRAFDELEPALEWLQQTRTLPPPARRPALATQYAEAFTQRISAQLDLPG